MPLFFCVVQNPSGQDVHFVHEENGKKSEIKIYIKIYINNTNKVAIICFDTDKNIQDKQKIFIYR